MTRGGGAGPSSSKFDAKGNPPAKGSFPLDHFRECHEVKEEYFQCLHRNHHDNMSCRYLAKQYLQCRMDHNLMEKEPLTSLGFANNEVAEKPERPFNKEIRKEDVGFVAGVRTLQPYYDRGLFGKIFGRFERKISRERRKERLEEEFRLKQTETDGGGQMVADNESQHP
eukprot:GHVS01005701.1.p1 GENE.GHVS01005701.1~~GHVS01005701.1.p1  ORF type:complete len:169 (+),score=27.46 GHVS01005701.1:78-584(+)